MSYIEGKSYMKVGTVKDVWAGKPVELPLYRDKKLMKSILRDKKLNRYHREKALKIK